MITPRVELRTARGGSRTAGKVLYHDDREPANARARRTHDAPAVREGCGAAPREAARAEGSGHRRRRALPPAAAPRGPHALHPIARHPPGRGRNVLRRRDRHQPSAARALAPSAADRAARRERLRHGHRLGPPVDRPCRAAWAADDRARPRRGVSMRPRGELLGRLRASLPFSLTAAQERVWDDIRRDMAAPYPMHRLLQGDVGSGKTVVAALAVCTAVEAGYQAAVMAPTEILAEQHLATFRRLLEPLGIGVTLLTSGLKGRERAARRAAIAAGEIGCVIGTHALVQEPVEFKRLGLAVVDEQHRFGVHQRARLKGKGERPDVLVMTATPIPRTLALTLYGDLDVSVLDELPPGRKPVRTDARTESRRRQIYDFL